MDNELKERCAITVEFEPEDYAKVIRAAESSYLKPTPFCRQAILKITEQKLKELEGDGNVKD